MWWYVGLSFCLVLLICICVLVLCVFMFVGWSPSQRICEPVRLCMTLCVRVYVFMFPHLSVTGSAPLSVSILYPSVIIVKCVWVFFCVCVCFFGAFWFGCIFTFYYVCVFLSMLLCISLCLSAPLSFPVSPCVCMFLYA